MNYQSSAALRIAAVVMGQAMAFIMFTVAKYTPLNVYRGQLIAGDRVANNDYPTTLTTFQQAMDGASPYANIIWWSFVIIIGLILSPFALRFLRRYV